MKSMKDVTNGVRQSAGVLKMSPIQATTWLACWSAWTLGSMQFYLLPFTLATLAKVFQVQQSKVSEANTTSLLSRSIGAAIFGIASDQYGRKIPLLVNLVLLGVFTLSSGFVHTYGQLVGVRLLFGRSSNSNVLHSWMLVIQKIGIAYGGTYGLIMATALEATPRRARGVVAGFTQQGFAAGYMLASGFHLAMS
jgi:MFS transporter, SHS family, lactate transporter